MTDLTIRELRTTLLRLPWANGALVLNVTPLMFKAALVGFGLACLFEDLAQAHLAKERLVRVLDDWCPPFRDHYLQYPAHEILTDRRSA